MISPPSWLWLPPAEPSPPWVNPFQWEPLLVDPHNGLCWHHQSPYHAYPSPPLRKILDFISFYDWKQKFTTLAWGSICSNPFWFELTGFWPELNWGPADNPNFLSPALFSTQLWWRMHHRRSFRTLCGDGCINEDPSGLSGTMGAPISCPSVRGSVVVETPIKSLPGLFDDLSSWPSPVGFERPEEDRLVSKDTRNCPGPLPICTHPQLSARYRKLG